MIEHVEGNIINIKSDILINASNGKGWMGGIIGRYFLLKGVAETIHFHDHTIEKQAKRICKTFNLTLGDVFLTKSGSLGFDKGVIHAITMMKPGQESNLNTIERCLDNITNYCLENGISSATIPLLGTGTGGLDKKDVFGLFEKRLVKHPTIFKVVHYRR